MDDGQPCSGCRRRVAGPLGELGRGGGGRYELLWQVFGWMMLVGWVQRARGGRSKGDKICFWREISAYDDIGRSVISRPAYVRLSAEL